jgi:hypothetical protein
MYGLGRAVPGASSARLTCTSLAAQCRAARGTRPQAQEAHTSPALPALREPLCGSCSKVDTRRRRQRTGTKTPISAAAGGAQTDRGGQRAGRRCNLSIYPAPGNSTCCCLSRREDPGDRHTPVPQETTARDRTRAGSDVQRPARTPRRRRRLTRTQAEESPITKAPLGDRRASPRTQDPQHPAVPWERGKERAPIRRNATTVGGPTRPSRRQGLTRGRSAADAEAVARPQRRGRRGAAAEARPQRRGRRGAAAEARPQRRGRRGAAAEARPQRRGRRGAAAEARPQRRGRRGAAAEARPQRRGRRGAVAKARPQRRGQGHGDGLARRRRAQSGLAPGPGIVEGKSGKAGKVSD